MQAVDGRCVAVVRRFVPPNHSPDEIPGQVRHFSDRIKPVFILGEYRWLMHDGRCTNGLDIDTSSRIRRRRTGVSSEPHH